MDSSDEVASLTDWLHRRGVPGFRSGHPVKMIAAMLVYTAVIFAVGAAAGLGVAVVTHDPVSEVVMEAREHAEEGDWETATGLYEQVLAADWPERRRAFTRDDVEEELAQVRHRWADAILADAEEELGAGQWAAAQQGLTRALEIAPDHPRARVLTDDVAMTAYAAGLLDAKLALAATAEDLRDLRRELLAGHDVWEEVAEAEEPLGNYVAMLRQQEPPDGWEADPALSATLAEAVLAVEVLEAGVVERNHWSVAESIRLLEAAARQLAPVVERSLQAAEARVASEPAVEALAVLEERYESRHGDPES